MKMSRLVATTVATIVLSSASLGAQQSPDSTARAQQRALDSLAASVRAMQARLDSAERTPAPAPAPVQARTSGAYMNVSFVGLTDFAWSSQQDLSALQRGGHEPKVRGFSVPNAELALDGTVDPYLKAFVNIVHSLDSKGETSTELEEMYFLTTGLPHNLQLKLGQFNGEFGRQNLQHPHAWAFADQPLVLNRMLGQDGLRSQGVRISWLLPTSFYTEAMFTVMNSAGATAFSFRSDESSDIHAGTPVDRGVKGVGDMLYVPRITTSFDLNDTQTLLLGASGAFGPNNSGPQARTSIYGGDLYWKWKSPRADAGFPFVAVQSEYLFRRYDAATRSTLVPQGGGGGQLPAETLKDNGAYAQVQWGIRPRIVAGLRGEYVNGDKAQFDVALREKRTRISPNFTWFPTEFSKFRIQYNYDNRQGLGGDHTLLMQFEFLLGAHAAHKF
jgi:hypothetical protein